MNAITTITTFTEFTEAYRQQGTIDGEIGIMHAMPDVYRSMLKDLQDGTVPEEADDSFGLMRFCCQEIEYFYNRLKPGVQVIASPAARKKEQKLLNFTFRFLLSMLTELGPVITDYPADLRGEWLFADAEVLCKFLSNEEFLQLTDGPKTKDAIYDYLVVSRQTHSPAFMYGAWCDAAIMTENWDILALQASAYTVQALTKRLVQKREKNSKHPFHSTQPLATLQDFLSYQQTADVAIELLRHYGRLRMLDSTVRIPPQYGHAEYQGSSSCAFCEKRKDEWIECEECAAHKAALQIFEPDATIESMVEACNSWSTWSAPRRAGVIRKVVLQVKRRADDGIEQHLLATPLAELHVCKTIDSASYYLSTQEACEIVKIIRAKIES